MTLKNYYTIFMIVHVPLQDYIVLVNDTFVRRDVNIRKFLIQKCTCKYRYVSCTVIREKNE